MLLTQVLARRSGPLLALLVAACGGLPSLTPPTPAPSTTSLPAREHFQVALTPDITLDYRIERKISEINQRTCYAFITGSLHNRSPQTLSRQSVLDITVIHNGKPLFRDLTNPVADIPPGARVMFGLVDSPVHKDGCPRYDRLDISLRPVIAQ